MPRTVIGGQVASDVLDRILRERAGEPEPEEADSEPLEDCVLDLLAAIRQNNVAGAAEALRNCFEVLSLGNDDGDGLGGGGLVRKG